MKYILAIDQSTSATKALLYDAQWNRLDKVTVEHQQIYPQPGWVEHDLEEIWKNVLGAVSELIARHRDKVASIGCISLTNQRETMGVFERGTGRPLHHAMVWQCRRGAAICQELEDAGHAKQVKERTGLRLDTYFPASKLKWLIEQDAGLRAKLRDGEALVGTVDTYLIYRLTGGDVFATDHTNASRTLLYDIGQLRWDEWLCELFEVPINTLPEVRESSARFGQTTFGSLLPNPVPICGVMGDSQASLFAQHCYKPGTAKVTFGTGSSVLLNIGDKLRFSQSGTVTTIAWVWSGHPTYSFEGIINYSAASIAWLKDQLGMLQSYAEAGELAAAVPDNGGVYLIPAFAGLSAPYWKPDARAALVGLSAHSNRNHVIRAAEESIAYQVRDVLDMMKADAGIGLRSIHADGGATKDAFLMQFTADVAGLEVLVSDVPECSPLGAAMSGALGLGLFKSMDELTVLTRKGKTYRPAMDPDFVERNYSGWKRAVQRVL